MDAHEQQSDVAAVRERRVALELPRFELPPLGASLVRSIERSAEPEVRRVATPLTPTVSRAAGHAHDHAPSHAHNHAHAHAHAHSHAGGSCEGNHGLFDAHHHDWSHLALAPRSKRFLTLALYVQLAFLLLEVAGGLLTNSLSLLGDAAHMLADVGALALALLAAKLAARPADATRTWGMARAETLAAAVNSATLVLSCAWIAVEAIRRLVVPEPIDGAGLMAIASAGLAANLIGAWLLAQADRDNLNIRAAMAHLLIDAASSVGVIIAGIVIMLGGPALIDTVASLLIAFLAVRGTWPVLRSAVAALLDAVPDGIDVHRVVDLLRRAPGVTQVHDVHVWEPGPRRTAVTAHVLVAPGVDIGSAILDLRTLLARDLGIDHATLQVAHDRSVDSYDLELQLTRDAAVDRTVALVASRRPSLDLNAIAAATRALVSGYEPEARVSPVRLTSSVLRRLDAGQPVG